MIIRTTLKKTKGKNKLERVVYEYNKSINRGIWMCPNEAILSINRDTVLEKQLKYEKEFIKATYRKSNDIFNNNENVLIKNEIRNKKMDKECIGKGKVLKSIGNICYPIIRMLASC
ncbi:hypothetical protein DMUE_0711 [Dictyocoela muelleri]|nr:hypothetical protein DMUE_0711 [Dictyocoela muelleri]